MGYKGLPGIADATVPNPIFQTDAAATVDAGQQGIKIAWGPTGDENPSTNVTLGNYAPAKRQRRRR